MGLPGIVVLDTTCYKYLVDESVRRRLFLSLRAVDLEVAPSALNALQLVRIPDRHLREHRLEAIRAVARGRPLLPWPYDYLRSVAMNFRIGVAEHWLSPSEYEPIVEDLMEPTDAEIIRIIGRVDAMDATWLATHARNRPRIQARLREMNLSPTPDQLVEFLESAWSGANHYGYVLDQMWRTLELPGECPHNLTVDCRAWKIMIESFGAEIFGRAIQHDEARVVDRTDFLQLTYLGIRDRAVFVSEDRPLIDTAKRFVTGRYPGARVMHWREFAPLHDFPANVAR